MTARATYAIRVAGHLEDHWADRLGCADLRREERGTTSLVVAVTDDAQLQGVLGSLSDLGASLLELRVVERR
ncbi:hypothetical protein [Nocardioides sp. YIM 152588]|uniref:hypothetical protein n=1 Tax=Nocardioides sp. YIM 152588 TaxID=3158259 RepID=UPI0032E49025